MADLAYFDACLFIELLQQGDKARFDACEALRKKAQAKALTIITSMITITEVNKLPGSKELPEEQSKKILDFFENPYIVVRPLDRRTAEYAHELTRTLGLKNMDAIHLATALLNRVPVLYTYDLSKGRRKGLLPHHQKVKNPAGELLRIEQPPDPDEGTLFDPKHAADEAAP